MVLNKPQAEAIYSAMCALNNVIGRIGSMSLPEAGIVVNEFANGRVIINSIYVGDESHANQAAFAAAYGLQQG